MKKILGSILIVALVLSLMMLPGIALADDTTQVSGDVAPTANVTSINPDHGDQGATLTGVVIGGTNFQTGATVSFSGTDINVTGSHVDSATQITANVSIDASAATGLRDVIVTQGGKIGTGVNLFTVNELPYITVTPPSAIDLGAMTAGVYNFGSSTSNGTVETNVASWQVTAKDAANGGFMKSGATALTNKFQVSLDNSTFADANTGITYDNTLNPDKELPFYVKQNVDQNDAGGSYSITITFTGSIL